jgi:hypothetical protein
MVELGHTDPELALSIYAHAMRRDDGENERLKALVDGVDLGGLGTSAHSQEALPTAVSNHREAASRSASGV